ncbi:MAG: hypothetical protein COX79_00025 [Candidatus Levybacteria bacterium CG_4_10_14_0_2_um_filter_36_16]|nr:MAG: hypothetical protein AUK12_00615 [Candidatus Levybacteria bacterium CG2_30_37_29]PIR78806.1 MAG: hypothetical protein COU26_04585 [Candidatus Levybacteria bacterium CG10_big_fil_rev_8_21_14_0_10_36_30]PIZ98026.1 MAG: hypothetical protein COX79_00025 [Candidatus Levybacteria bacterium CG_4_10_14_0_2_um_filter_36_16]
MKKLLIYGYCCLLFFFSFFSYLFIDPGLLYLRNFYTGFFSENRLVVIILYTLFICLFFLTYYLFIKLVRSEKLPLKQIFLLIVANVSILLFSYPAILSFDIFNYIATAKVAFFYHENPYIVMPYEFIGDPLLLFMHAANKVALYAPFWTLLSAIPHLLGFNNFLITLFNLKFFISLFYVAGAFLVWKISKNIYSVVLFALNPLIVIETLVSSHNDIVMMFFALCAFFFAFKKKFILALLFLFFSIFIKYATIVLLPIFIYMLIKYKSGEKIDQQNIFLIAAFLMFIVFLFSFLREEIYPWYAIWFLTFISFLPKKKNLVVLSTALSFGLLLRYVPFMFLGTYFGLTPLIKVCVTVIPVFIVLAWSLISKYAKKYN